MNQRTRSALPLLTMTVLCLMSGCAERSPGGSAGPAGESVLPGTGPRAVVEEYLRAAATADGQRMYALIASSERDDESPDTLRETAADRYSASMMWEVLKAEEKGSTSDVIVEFKGAKVEPNPYRFTLTREAGEWRIVQSPELHEEKKDGIKIDLG